MTWQQHTNDSSNTIERMIVAVSQNGRKSVWARWCPSCSKACPQRRSVSSLTCWACHQVISHMTWPREQPCHVNARFDSAVGVNSAHLELRPTAQLAPSITLPSLKEAFFLEYPQHFFLQKVSTLLRSHCNNNSAATYRSCQWVQRWFPWWMSSCSSKNTAGSQGQPSGKSEHSLWRFVFAKFTTLFYSWVPQFKSVFTEIVNLLFFKGLFWLLIDIFVCLFFSVKKTITISVHFCHSKDSCHWRISSPSQLKCWSKQHLEETNGGTFVSMMMTTFSPHHTVQVSSSTGSQANLR